MLRITDKWKILIAAALGVVVYSVAAFLLLPLGTFFYIGYGFLIFAFLVFALCCLLLAKEPFDAENMLYNKPVLEVAGFYAVAAAVQHLVFSVLPGMSVKIVICVELVIFLIFAIRGAAVQMGTANARAQREGQKQRTAVLLSACNIVAAAADRSTDAQLKRALKRTAEELRLAPVLKNDRLSGQDDEILQAARSLEAFVKDGDTVGASEENERLTQLIKARNRAAGATR